ncbi:MAG: endonuclease V [Promethearchaeota archaeon]
MSVIQELLIDDYSPEQAEAIQVKYQNLLMQMSKKKYIRTIKVIDSIVGVDISYYKKEQIDYGIACAVVWNLNQKKVDSFYFAKDLITFPYKPGFLGFRECKLLAKVISKIPNKPNLILCDGHGKIHPKRFGEAVHLGFALNISTIGVAKNPFIGYFNFQNIKLVKGSKSPIWAQNPRFITKNSFNELLGYLICLNEGSKPVFISTGYNISLNIALKVCLKSTIEHRQPEPLHLADKLSRKEINRYI